MDDPGERIRQLEAPGEAAQRWSLLGSGFSVLSREIIGSYSIEFYMKETLATVQVQRICSSMWLMDGSINV